MRRSRATLAALTCALALVASGCEAPLKPDARETPRAQPAPQESANPAAEPTAEASATPTPSRGPRRPGKPDVTVPKGLEGGRLPDRGIVLGADISWPQCPAGMGIPQKRSHGGPMPVPQARYVILGLTNGPGFYPNPCLASQVQWVEDRRLMAAAYSIISWPQGDQLERFGGQGPYDGSTRGGALANVGYQQARYNLATMKRAGLRTPMIWLDVEPVPDFDWPADTAANAEVVKGAARGYRDAGYAIGAYSTQALWQRVVGDLALGLPEWRAAGQTSRAEALRRCGRDRMFQGGEAVISQWVEADRDMNVTCPGQSARLATWFHQY